MPRQSRSLPASGSTILLVDDSPEYLQATRALLEREGHEVLSAPGGAEALDLLRRHRVDLVLIDYFMPGMTAADVVTELRRFNPYVQVILQTGYASEQPPRDLLRRLDIQGYFDKSEGPEKLLLWTDVGLKAAYTVQLLAQSRQGLRYILEVTPDLHRVQPLNDLLQGILLQIAGLLGAANSFLAVLPGEAPAAPDHPKTPGPGEAPEGFVAMVSDDEANLVIRAGTGRFAGRASLADSLDAERQALVRKALREGRIQVGADNTVVPLRVGESLLGVVFLDRPAEQERDAELLGIFANQASVAIHNSQLYEMATLDPLTGVYVRRFLDQLVLRELGTAFRAQRAAALLLIDLDGLKRVNDSAGHLTGDQALAAMGSALRKAMRGADLPGRYGGDEFVVILPQTDGDGAEQVGRRVLEVLAGTRVVAPQREFRLGASIGVASIPPHAFAPGQIPRPVPQAYFQKVAKALLQRADEALYAAKRGGGGRLDRSTPLEWPSFDR